MTRGIPHRPRKFIELPPQYRASEGGRDVVAVPPFTAGRLERQLLHQQVVRGEGKDQS